jgi:bifunctional non-homologous end joining protein LigD
VTPAARSAERLERYHAKRDFEVTAEPQGGGASMRGNRFVVQRHRARRLHYDLRLELDGVLVSWAVPRGPTLDPRVRRLAVHVEDHPVEYFDFEGTIPAGEYGGGDVVVWDWGTWRPASDQDPAEALEAGSLHFDLEGEKLHGRFVLVRKGRGGAGSKEQWLLIHKHDDFAVDGWDPEQHLESVKSGRTNDEVAAAPAATWRSNRSGDTSDFPSWQAPTEDELEALEDLGVKGTWEFQGINLRLTNLDKVLFPAGLGSGPVTKRDLVRYHACIAPAMLPYLNGRPLNRHRYPDGIGGKSFWAKQLPGHAPDWLTRWHRDEAHAGEADEYLVADRPASLAWLANDASLELHPWTSTVVDVHRPTWALIDIDPGPETSFEEVLLLARLYRTALAHLGLSGGPKVTGQRGIQIWVPVKPRYTFQDTSRWVERISRMIGDTVPDLVSWSWQTRDRHGLARLDYTQNTVNKTLVAPFSARPAPGAPVSVPITWDELEDPELRPDRWTANTVLARLAEVGDPLRPLVGLEQELPELDR